MKQNKKWKKLLYSLCMILFFGLAFPKIAVYAEEVTESIEQTVSETEGLQELSFTDQNGNHFIYTLNEDGKATITSITTSGQSLVIPTSIADAPVIAVANGSACVVQNSEVTIPELTINCSTIGTNAFCGLCIGTLVIGENVTQLSLSSDVEFGIEFTYGQFAKSTIEKVVFQATELIVGHYTGQYLDDFQGAFYQAQIGDLEIGTNVTIIPELLFCDAIMELEELTLQAERIGEYAFASENIFIEHLTIGENVKVFAEYSNSTTLFHHWEQFAEASIGTYTYLSDQMELEHAQERGSYNNNQYAPFMYSTIENLEIGSNVTRLPELFLHDANIHIGELRLTQTSIGAFAFSGSGITIDSLILDTTVERLEEWYFSDEGSHHWEQFSEASIGVVKLYAPNLKLVKTVEKGFGSSHYIFASFMDSTIGSLEIGMDVAVLPDYFLYEAKMEMETLEIHVPVIGACAFSSPEISIGTLKIGKEVVTFPESYFSTDSYHYWEQFADCEIEHLIYEATDAEVINDVEEVGGISTYFCGPFDDAVIKAFTLDKSVVSIPNFLLKDSISQIEALDLHVSEVGAYAFSGGNIQIGKLTLGEEIEIFHNAETTSSSYHYWEQFSESTIGEVYYNVPSLTLEDEAEHDDFCYGPFYLSKIGKLYLSPNTIRYPAYCFLNAYLEQDELEIHAESIGVRAFSGKNISIGTLTIGKELQQFEWVDSGFSTYFRQFMDCTIGTLIYLPISAETGEECTRGVFDTASIGNLVIDSAVEKIPNYLFYNTILELEDFMINVPDIGYYSFASESITFEKLTIGEAVSTFCMNKKGYNRAFNANAINLLCYNATEGQMETLSSSVYGPFSYETQVNGLTVGENVKVLPYGCFREAEMELTELNLNNVAIGYAAFCGSNIHIGTLNIGNNVSYEGVVSNQMNCFKTAKIDILNYNSNAVEPEWSTSKSSYGMFAQAIIGQLNIGEDVKIIPAFWFRSATLKQDVLTLSCAWSHYSFYSSSIHIGTLTLNGEMSELTHIDNNNLAFSTATIDTLVYNLPNAAFSATKGTASGPFTNAKITTFILGENVEYIDYRILRGNTITDCYVYAVNGSENFLSQNLTESYLPICTNLHIHYNSNFKTFFSKEVTEYHWLCVDYFDTTYGEKLYDEESETYLIELFKTCSICGYEEESTEELDGSYDVYLSIPIEISLSFDAEQKSYIGQEMLFAYGTLGSAYEGVSLTIDTHAESYGTAIMGENSYDISDYLSVGFHDKESAIFDTNQLLENAKYVNGEGTDSLHQEQMNISVDGMAFVEGGAGEYRISIPLRFELVK